MYTSSSLLAARAWHVAGSLHALARARPTRSPPLFTRGTSDRAQDSKSEKGSICIYRKSLRRLCRVCARGFNPERVGEMAAFFLGLRFRDKAVSEDRARGL